MDDRKIKVLLGFKLRNDKEDRKAETKMITQIKAMGYDPNFYVRTTKRDVQNYLTQNRDCQHVVLMETIGQSTWSQNELADLVDERNLNIVIILTAQRAKQLEYLTTLYAAGITSAIFEQGRGGVPAEEVAELLIKQRSRKAAREYYRIDTKNISIRSLTNEMYNGLVVKLMDSTYGPSTMSRLLTLAGSINPYQMGDFLNKLPEDVIKELYPYTEYAQLVAQLKESGIRAPYKRPKQYKTMEEDVSFNDSAAENLNKKGMDANPFIKKEQPKRKLFGRKTADNAKKREDGTSETMLGEMQPALDRKQNVIENMSAYHDWSGNETETGWETPPIGTEGDEEENTVDLSKLRKSIPDTFPPDNPAGSVINNVEDDDDDELGMFL